MFIKQFPGWTRDYVNVVVIYSERSGVRVGQAVSKLINQLWVNSRIARFNILVYTNIEKPFFMENLRSFLQSNLANSIVIWWMPLKQIHMDIDALIKTNVETYILIDKDLVDELSFLKEKGVRLEVF